MLKGLFAKLFSAMNLKLWVRCSRGFYIKIDSSNTVGRSIFYRKSYDERMAMAISDMLVADSVFFDVGANIGYFSLLASTELRGRGQVFAVEANTCLVEMLNESKSRNNLQNLEILNAAAGSRPGSVDFQVLRSSGVSFVGGEDSIRNNDKVIKSVRVSVLTLDSLLQRVEAGRRLVFKIDTEGYEMEVLKGMESILLRPDVQIIIEVSAMNLSRNNHTPSDIFEFLKSRKFICSDLDGNQVESIGNDVESDYLFTRA